MLWVVTDRPQGRILKNIVGAVCGSGNLAIGRFQLVEHLMSSRCKRCHQAARCLSCHAWLQLMKIESFSDTKHCKGCFQLPVFEKTRSYLDLLNPWQNIRRCGTPKDCRFMLILKMTPRCGETHIFTHSYYDPFQNEERHVVVVDVMSPEIRANVPRQPNMLLRRSLYIYSRT